MLNEIVTQSHVLLPGVEQSFGVLAAPHALAEILVNPNGDLAADKSEWRLYDVGPAGAALIWRGDLTPPFQGTQRLTPEGGIAAGGLYELRALNLGANPTAVPITASLIGYDPACCEPTPPPECCPVLTWGAELLPSSNQYLTPGYAPSASLVAIDAAAVRDGEIRGLRVVQNDPGVGTGTTQYILEVNGVPTPLNATLDLTDSAGSDLVNAVPILAGDLYRIRALVSGEDVVTNPGLVVATALFCCTSIEAPPIT